MKILTAGSKSWLSNPAMRLRRSSCVLDSCTVNRYLTSSLDAYGFDSRRCVRWVSCLYHTHFGLMGVEEVITNRAQMIGTNQSSMQIY